MLKNRTQSLQELDGRATVVQMAEARVAQRMMPTTLIVATPRLPVQTRLPAGAGDAAVTTDEKKPRPLV